MDKVKQKLISDLIDDLQESINDCLDKTKFQLQDYSITNECLPVYKVKADKLLDTVKRAMSDYYISVLYDTPSIEERGKEKLI